MTRSLQALLGKRSVIDWHCQTWADCMLQASGGEYPEPVQALLSDLLALTAPARQPPLHWRFALLANLALILLLPPPNKARHSLRTGAFAVSAGGAAMLRSLVLLLMRRSSCRATAQQGAVSFAWRHDASCQMMLRA